SVSLRRAANSLRSWPAQKAGPLAQSTTARTALSLAISVNAAESCASIASDSVLRCCGRLSVSSSMPPPSRSRISAASVSPRTGDWMFMVASSLRLREYWAGRPAGATSFQSGTSASHQTLREKNRSQETIYGQAREAEIAQAQSFATALVSAGHADQRCPDAGEKCVQEAERPADRAVSQALSRAQPPAQIRPVSLGDVDAHLLHQPRRSQSPRLAQEEAQRRQGRAARALRSSLKSHFHWRISPSKPLREEEGHGACASRH